MYKPYLPEYPSSTNWRSLSLSSFSLFFLCYFSCSFHSILNSHNYCSPSSSRSPSSSPPLSPDGSLCHLRSLSAYSHVHQSSPLSTSSLIVPDHRRHLNRLQSVPTISIPENAIDLTEMSTFDHREFLSEYPTSCPTLTSSPRTSTVNANNDLVNYLQCLQLRNRAVADLQKSRSNPVSPDHHQAQRWSSALSQQSSSGLNQNYSDVYGNLGGTPPDSNFSNSSSYGKLNKNCSEGVETATRVESGRDLRANFYGKIGKENGVPICAEINPDLGWVNELVKWFCYLLIYI